MILAIESTRWIEEGDGVRAAFDVDRLCRSIARACDEAGRPGEETAPALADAIAAFLGDMHPAVVVAAQDIRRWVDQTLRRVGLDEVAAAYMGLRTGEGVGPELVDFEAYGVHAAVPVERLQDFLATSARLSEEAARAVAHGVVTAARGLSYGRMTAGLLAELIRLECGSRGLRAEAEPEVLARWLLRGRRLEALRRDWATVLRDRLVPQDPGLRVRGGHDDAAAEVEVLLESLARRVSGGFELAFFQELSGVLDRVATAVLGVMNEAAEADADVRGHTIRLRLLGAESCAAHVQRSTSARRRRAFAAEVVDFTRAWLERRLGEAPCLIEPLI